jgi:hypothetical protein
MSNIKVLGKARPVNADTIQKLETYLEMAREGEIQEVVLVVTHLDGSMTSDWTATANVFERMGRIHHLNCRLSAELRLQYGE